MLIAGAINFYMLSSGLVILQYAMYAKLSLFEIISLRAGFSLYCGWVAAANIVNVAYVLKSSGFGSKDTELMWSQLTLCVGWCVYAAYGLIERNPLFSAVFIWVILAIRANQWVGTDKVRSEGVAITCTNLYYLHLATLSATVGLCAYELSNKSYAHGLFY